MNRITQIIPAVKGGNRNQLTKLSLTATECPENKIYLQSELFSGKLTLNRMGKEEHGMRPITMFYLESCGYCTRAKQALKELKAENPAYEMVEITEIEESRHPELAEQYDYYAVPSFYDGHTKLFEAHLFMSREDMREEVRKVLDYAAGN